MYLGHVDRVAYDLVMMPHMLVYFLYVKVEIFLVYVCL